MQLKQEESQEPQGGSFLEELASTGCGMLVLLFFLVVLVWACMAAGMAATGNPPF
jgi:flagellar biogenesis protein FliO